jgi:hypothetical protein
LAKAKRILKWHRDPEGTDLVQRIRKHFFTQSALD